MKRKLLLLILISTLLFSTMRVKTSIKISTVAGEPDFVLVDDIIPSLKQPGVLGIGANIKNNGTGNAIAGFVPVTWEDLCYELVLDNGTGMLNETAMDYDLDGDGDKTATYNVTWFHNINRQWDAVINGSSDDKHVYSLWEGPIESPWSNQTHDINGTSKLFQLGNQMHVLYGADNDTACFGFGAVIMTHPGPHLELEITSSTSAVSMMINWNPVVVNHNGTRKVYSKGNWSTTTRYIISSQAFELDAGKQVSFVFGLLGSEATTAYLGLFMNWSPDGNVRRNWKLHEATVPIQAVDRPFFWIRDYSYPPGETGERQFTAIVINSGLPATAGTVQTSQEDIMYQIAIPFGSGTLDESELGMDLNGDDDQTDTFEVTLAGSDTREGDVNITDGTTEIHAYAIDERGVEYALCWVMNYTINGQSKIFQLGSENHSLYWADSVEELVIFGLGNVVVLNHPSPIFQFNVESTGIDSLDNLTVEDFKINGQDAELNYTTSLIIKHVNAIPSMSKLYFVSKPGLEIATGEQVTFSCTIKATSNTTFKTSFRVNWSPDGIQRYIWWEGANEDGLNITLYSLTSTTPTTFTTSTTPPTPTTTSSRVPGFSFLTSAVLAVPIVLTRRRRKSN
ncbi:MAG: hypothetical protein ACXAEU_04185 [Candidatus Hodarchaeales archaeon]